MGASLLVLTPGCCCRVGVLRLESGRWPALGEEAQRKRASRGIRAILIRTEGKEAIPVRVVRKLMGKAGPLPPTARTPSPQRDSAWVGPSHLLREAFLLQRSPVTRPEGEGQASWPGEQPMLASEWGAQRGAHPPPAVLEPGLSICSVSLCPTAAWGRCHPVPI